MEPKSFIATDENLLFAVVSPLEEQGKALCFLRYAYLDRQWRKLPTDQANQLLSQSYPHYLHFSAALQASLHAVPIELIKQHYQPRKVLAALLDAASDDPVINDLQQLCALFAVNGLPLHELGITGSLLVGMQTQNSDIDLVIYDRALFHRTRSLVQALIASGHCQTLQDSDWLDSFQRRGCDISLDEYIWHEQRKYNKALINGRKFDLSLLSRESEAADASFQKRGVVQIEARVIEDSHAFDYPAMFRIDHPNIGQVVCFTATYVGQAQCGEQIRVAGQLEVDGFGSQRVVVGSTREAIGEYIKVLQ